MYQAEFSIDPDVLQRAKAVLASTPAVDFHTHLGLWESRGLTDKPDWLEYPGDEIVRGHVEAMLASGCRTASVNITSDIAILDIGVPGSKWRDFKPGEAWSEYQRMISALQEMCDWLPVAIAHGAADLEAIHDRGKLALLLSVEGAHMVEEDPGKLQQLARDGVSKFQPLHYATSLLGDTQSDPPIYGGMSSLGRELVSEAANLGMIIDTAHATLEACHHMAEATDKPLVLSHTLMQFQPSDAAAGDVGNARWITPDHARMIAGTSGLIGTWAPNYPIGARSAQQLIEAIMAMIETVGIDHVCWSTDLIHVGMGPWFPDYRAFPDICAGLLQAGLSDADLQKLVHDNVMRIYQAYTVEERIDATGI